jgi:transcriptional regulator
MYIPSHFSATDPEELIEIMRRHPFATLITTDESGRPVANHIPFLIETGPLRLLAHVARANPLLRDLDREVLVVFLGPHAYVSPTWYQAETAASSAPTWNYAAVHARGRARILDEAGTAGMLERLTDEHERGRWSAELETPTRRAMLRAVVGFAIDAPEIEGKLKLSQNRTAEDRERVRAAHADAAYPDGPELAAMMARQRSRSAR